MIETANKTNQHSKGENMKNFTLNSKNYQADSETVNVIKSIIKSAKSTNDSSAVMAVMFLGMSSGRIKEI
jgi:hypothetical protein